MSKKVLLLGALLAFGGRALAEEVIPPAAESARPAPEKTAAQAGNAGETESATLEDRQEKPAVAEGSKAANLYGLRDELRIRLQRPAGRSPLVITDSLALGVYVVMDDVPMKSLGEPTVEAPADGKGLILSFHLARNPELQESREEWARLLEKKSGGSILEPKLALALAGQPAIPVATPNGFKFQITTKTMLYWTLAIGLLLFFLLFWRLATSQSALRDAPGGHFSLGKSQMAFWGLLVPITFVGVFANTGMLEYIPDQILILMGISAATGLGSVVIGVAAQAASGDKVPKLGTGKDPANLKANQDSQGRAKWSNRIYAFFKDICDDGNGTSFHRLQTVMWTLILGIIFVAKVSRAIAMPEFSPTLLTLMGISNSIYLGFKTREPPA